MKIVKNIIAGLAGALSLNILHESLKHLNADMPRIDLVGEEALNKVLGSFGAAISNENKLYKATLASDVISNAIYYSLIGAGSAKFITSRAIVSGLSAGLGAVNLPDKMGLNDRPVTKSAKTKVLTVAYYLTGALVTAAVLKAMNKR
ncbi:hypothetical protein [Pedobacter aquatilis]|uniref:hypothetical protein n=1 Tax=Pedobacter aquatilis TaxID=351343 RepID=UPI00292EB6F0|nr:hypothetical protein [Pedobacter aquatilis]